MESLFANVWFQQPPRASQNLRLLSQQLPAPAWEALPRLLANLPDPDAAVNNLQRFAAHAPPEVLRSMAEQPGALYHVLALFSYSQYLSDTLIHDPRLALWLRHERALYRVKLAEEMLQELSEFAKAPEQESVAQSTIVSRFKRREYLRIALRDALRLATLAEVTLELSGLADAILQWTLQFAMAETTERYGTPLLPAAANGEGRRDCDCAVLSLGKLGGNELNYSSDIDLVFLYRANGETTKGVSNKDYFVTMAHRMVGILGAFGPAGAVFRVDLRLRPEGREGDMAVSLDFAASYYRERARPWELQALIKARCSAGSAALAIDFLAVVEPLIYSSSVDFSAIDSVLFARERMTESLKRRSATRLGIDVKLERGGIRDIEFLVQCLQRLYGGQESWLRSGGTLFGLQKLADKGYLRQADYGRLSRAYIFQRNIEHLLQLEQGQQTHRLSASPDALTVIARRARILQQVATGAAQPGEMDENDPYYEGKVLLGEVRRHMKEVREIYDRLILAHSTAENRAAEFALEPDPVSFGEPGATYTDLLARLEANCPALYRIVSQLPVNRGRKQVQRFLTSAWASPADFTFLCNNPEVLDRAAEIFEYSPFLSELLVRHPGEIVELAALPAGQEPLTVEQQRRIPAETPYAVQDDPILMHISAGGASLTEKMALMREHYRRRLLRTQAHSLLGPVPVFSTLEATSVLAEQVLRAAYRAAVEDTARSLPRPDGELIVIALGRLGIREFDLGSDADLAFLYQGGDPDAKFFWTRVAERLIEIVSAYTGEGTIFSVDTRLRPRGREGELVEAEPNIVRYFSSAAEPWEAVSYMKSRVVAGDVEEGTVLLTRIQNRIGARFGRGPEAARKLVDMRKRLEEKSSAANRLKAAPGGYYDIDFILTYLRLQAAQVFFPSLTTPERLRVVHEWMGQLRADQARTLHDGAVLYRGVEHAMRISSGRSDQELPPPGPRLEVLDRLASRWLPQSLRGRPLDESIEEMLKAVRGIFREVFGS